MSSGGCRRCGSRRSAMGQGRRSFPSRTCCGFVWAGSCDRRRRLVDHVDRFGVSMDPELLTAFDQLTRRRGYKSRSEAIRDIVRHALVEEEWREGDQPVIGTVTLVYDHDSHDLAHELMDLQHHHHEAIVCTTHVHMDAHNCM